MTSAPSVSCSLLYLPMKSTILVASAPILQSTMTVLLPRLIAVFQLPSTLSELERRPDG